MGVKKERIHVNLVGKHTVGKKAAKAGSRAKHIGRRRAVPLVAPPRPGRRP